MNREVVHLHDIIDTDAYRNGDSATLKAVELEGTRTFLAVPILTPAGAIGTIGLYRREVRPFTEEQIAIVKTFAAQAVIAIENVRQFRELQTRLEREAATTKVLQVISQSRDDEQPVFDSILEQARRLCSAPFAGMTLMNDEGTEAVLVANSGGGAFYSENLQTTWSMDSDLLVPRVIREKAILHVEDLSNDRLYYEGDPQRVDAVEKAGIRTFLGVPLVSDGVGIGGLGLYRTEVRPFSADEISLVETFAAQAVIAIENVRQFKALESLNAELGDRVNEQVGEIERMGKLKRFLPAAVADTVVSQGAEATLKSHRALLGVLFCDIRCFSVVGTLFEQL